MGIYNGIIFVNQLTNRHLSGFMIKTTDFIDICSDKLFDFKNINSVCDFFSLSQIFS